MANELSAADTACTDTARKRPRLSPRDRSLITVATLVALCRTNELPCHLNKALANGIRKDELIELIAHLAGYAGWPMASCAVDVARKVFDGDMEKPRCARSFEC